MFAHQAAAPSETTDPLDLLLNTLRAVLRAQYEQRVQDVRVCDDLTAALRTDVLMTHEETCNLLATFMQTLGFPPDVLKPSIDILPIGVLFPIFAPTLKEQILIVDVENLDVFIKKIDMLYEAKTRSTKQDKQDLIDDFCDLIHIRAIKAADLHTAYQCALTRAKSFDVTLGQYEARDVQASNELMLQVTRNSTFGDSYAPLSTFLFKIFTTCKFAGMDLSRSDINEQISQESFMEHLYIMLKHNASPAQLILEELYQQKLFSSIPGRGQAKISNLAITNIHELQALYEQARSESGVMGQAAKLLAMKRRRNTAGDQNLLKCADECESQYRELGEAIASEKARLYTEMQRLTIAEQQSARQEHRAPQRVRVQNQDEHRALKKRFGLLLDQMARIKGNQIIPELLAAAEERKRKIAAAAEHKATTTAKGTVKTTDQPASAAHRSSIRVGEAAPTASAAPASIVRMPQKVKSKPKPTESELAQAVEPTPIDPKWEAARAAEQAAREERARIDAERARLVAEENARLVAASKAAKAIRKAKTQEAIAAVEARAQEIEAMFREQPPESKLAGERLESVLQNQRVFELMEDLYNPKSRKDHYKTDDLKKIVACLKGITSQKVNIVLFQFNTTQEGDERPSQLVIGPFHKDHFLPPSQVRAFVGALQRESSLHEPGLGITEEIFRKFCSDRRARASVAGPS